MTLTERQRQVLSLMCEGLSNRQIGERLGISPGTVKVHTRVVFLRLGVQTRAQAIVKELRP